MWYSGRTHDFGGSVQALFCPSGIPLWLSDVLPGNVHDLAAARENVLGILRPFLDAMPVLADSGYEGAGHGVHVPVKKPAGVKELDIDTRARNALLRSVRCLGERGFALLTQWRCLKRPRKPHYVMYVTAAIASRLVAALSNVVDVSKARPLRC